MYNPGTEKCKYLIVPMPNKYTNHLSDNISCKLNFSWADKTDIDDTLHSGSIQPEDVHEER